MEVKTTELDVCLSRLDKRTNDLDLRQIADAYAEVTALRKIAADYDALQARVKELEESPEMKFVRHIEGHLQGDQVVMCKICGKTIFEISGGGK